MSRFGEIEARLKARAGDVREGCDVQLEEDAWALLEMARPNAECEKDAQE